MQVINEAECLDNASTSNKENEAFHETPFPGQSGGAPLDSTQVKQKSMKHNKLTEPISKEQQITAEIKKQKEIKKAKSSEKQQQEATIKEQRPSCSGQLKGKQKPAKKISHGLNTEHRVSDSGRKEKRESEQKSIPNLNTPSSITILPKTTAASKSTEFDTLSPDPSARLDSKRKGHGTADEDPNNVSLYSVHRKKKASKQRKMT
ncbi:unnamed protein product [Didymodactylos carnosus]|uniref:Uncharacterized protein n=1 Tax=Didymodactylos carnosus TaxID=1234261 RepID=A0A8S2DAE9_9BILA|nr:unnamed protein product [Didymodactylos carnosus]CAF3669290.1 unnamed protein product [Didymodactylos carnosus]